MGKHDEQAKQGSGQKQQRAASVWRPFGELEAWPSPWERGLFPRRFGGLLEELLRDRPGMRAQTFLPPVDLAEDDGHYAITVELPGMSKDDVHLEVHHGMLTLRGEKKSERDETKERRHYVERTYGAFSRSFTLPTDADAEHLTATFKDGVLTIQIPRSEGAKPRQIAIKTQ